MTAVNIANVSGVVGRPEHLRVYGGKPLAGSLAVRSSKNAAVALLCASLLNRGRTVLHNVARIVEVDRITAVLRSMGVTVQWQPGTSDLLVVPPSQLRLDALDLDEARRTRSVLLLLGPLIHHAKRFSLPHAGGCDLGTRTVEPHRAAARPFGAEVVVTDDEYLIETTRRRVPDQPVVLLERGDTVTENAILAAAGMDGTSVIRNASSNYMVQDLCFFLEMLGVGIDGLGTTNLTVHGVSDISKDVEYYLSEDPIEAMSLLTAGIVTKSEIALQRVPIEFLEIELAILDEMGLQTARGKEYAAANGRGRLVNLRVYPSELKAMVDKIHPMPFPGLNIDNIPFFAAIAACAEGSTLIHDWVYDNRATYLADLTKLGARIELLDPHRALAHGPTRWHAADVVCPPALRPAVVLLLAMLAAPGTSTLRNVSIIARGHENISARLVALGASIETLGAADK